MVTLTLEISQGISLLGKVAHYLSITNMEQTFKNKRAKSQYSFKPLLYQACCAWVNEATSKQELLARDQRRYIVHCFLSELSE